MSKHKAEQSSRSSSVIKRSSIGASVAPLSESRTQSALETLGCLLGKKSPHHQQVQLTEDVDAEFMAYVLTPLKEDIGILEYWQVSGFLNSYN